MEHLTNLAHGANAARFMNGRRNKRAVEIGSKSGRGRLTPVRSDCQPLSVVGMTDCRYLEDPPAAPLAERHLSRFTDDIAVT